MRSTLDELEKELGELVDLVASIAPVNSVLAAHQDVVVKRYVAVRRRFDYAAFSVSLYASFEKFIENLVAAYVRLKTRSSIYSDLPDSLQKKHLSRTAELLSRGRLGEGRYSSLTELDAVRNLFDCLRGASPYVLNEAAIVAHDANLRASEIDAVFTAVGIENVCERVRTSDALTEWYREVKQLEKATLEAVPQSTVEEWLRDIVDRRNQVAHRGGSPDDLSGTDAMRESIRFIGALGKSIFAIAVGRYLQSEHAQSHLSLNLREGDGPYRNGSVVVVEKPTIRLFVGQPLFVLLEAGGARWGRVQSLQVDGSEFDEIEADVVAENGVGIGLDFRCPRGATLFALERDDDVVWSPQQFDTEAAA